MYGTGFLNDSDKMYALNFTKTNNESPMLMSAKLLEFVNETTLVFLTPGWGYEYPSDIVNVTLVMHISKLSSPYVVGRDYYSFVPSWTPELISSTTGVASGKETVYLEGFGFGDKDSYTCRFSLVVGGAIRHTADGPGTYVNHKKVACTTPVWNYGASTVIVSLFFSRELPTGVSLEIGSQSNVTAIPGFYYIDPKGQNSLFEYVEVWQNLTAEATGALGGHIVRVYGHAFDAEPVSKVQTLAGEDITFSNKAYILQFNGPMHAVNSSACAVASATQLNCTMPAWLSTAGTATVTLIKTWVRASGNIRRRQNRVVVRDTGASESVNIVSEIARIEPTFGNKQGGANVTVLGAGFKPSNTYSCKFTQGSDEQILKAVKVTNSSIVCDVTVAWNAAGSTSTNTTFTLLESNSSVFALASVNNLFTFAFINKPPDFNGTNLVVSGQDTSALSIPWVTYVCAGVLPTGGCDPDEASQMLNYTIQVSQISLFSTLPKVNDKNLEFQIAAGQSGIAFLNVYAVDDGGTLYGGVDQSQTKTFSLDIQSEVRAPGGNVAQKSLKFEGDSYRNTSRTEVTGFFVFNSGENNLLQDYGDVTVEVHLTDGPAKMFQTMPKIYPNGSLIFEAARSMYGNATFNVSTYVFESNSQALVLSSLDNFTIEITKVSQLYAHVRVACVRACVCACMHYVCTCLYMKACTYVC